MTQRLDWLDFLKGVGIFLVVLGHIYLKCIGCRTSVFDLIVAFHMPFFFMLSGILAWKSIEKNILKSVLKKAKSLLIPFFVCGMAYALTFGELHNFVWNDFHAGYWFLFSLFLCWIMFLPLSKVVYKIPEFKGKPLVDAMILLIPFFVGKVINSILPSEYVHALTFSMTFSYYRFFIVGYFIGIIYKYICEYSKSVFWGANMKVIFQTFCIISFILIAFCILKDCHPANVLSETGVQLTLSVSIIGVCLAYKETLPKRIVYMVLTFGKYSLLIYCFHYFVIRKISLKEFASLSPFVLFLVASFVAIAVMVITLVLAKPIEKNKYLAKIFLGKL